MRSEQEMMERILGIAREDSRIRAVYLNGSRANPAVAQDAFRDYDIVYVVTDTAPFREDPDWPGRFGEVAILQTPDALDAAMGRAVDLSRSFGWLMLFRDGTRIDLHVETPATLSAYGADSLTVPLLDKDGLLPPLPPASDRSHWITPPTEGEYAACCSDFWWCLNNIAKGILRDQLPYAMRMYNTVVHPRLDDLVLWCIGARTGFSRSCGMWGKYAKAYLSPAEYTLYAASYSGGSYPQLWQAMSAAGDLFSSLARELAASLGLAYVSADEAGIRRYLRDMRTQYDPSDLTDIFSSNKEDTPMILETPRLSLREMTQADFPALCKILQDPEVMYAYEHAFSDAEAQDWLQRQQERYRQSGYGLWAVILKETGEMIGQCGLTPQTCNQRVVPEIGYLFQKAFWHQGYATEAAIACKEYAFFQLGAEEVFSIIRDNNLPSQRVALRNGMQVTETLMKHYYGMDMPHLVFSVKRQG